MPPNQNPAGKVDPLAGYHPVAAAVLEQAAKGDLQAQRRIRDACFDTFSPLKPEGEDWDHAAAGGLFVARMCAANGDYSDTQRLAALLLAMGIGHHDGGRFTLSRGLVSEAVALFERMSAAGDEEAAETVDKLVPLLPPDVVARAQIYAKPRKEIGDAAPNPQS